MKVVLHQPAEGANAGDTIDVGDLQGRWLVDHGYAHLADATPSSDLNLPPLEPEPEVEPPLPRAPKADWVAHAQTQGMTVDEADAMTKAQLIERFG
jgi:hypothetical protein